MSTSTQECVDSDHSTKRARPVLGTLSLKEITNLATQVVQSTLQQTKTLGTDCEASISSQENRPSDPTGLHSTKDQGASTPADPLMCDTGSGDQDSPTPRVQSNISKVQAPFVQESDRSEASEGLETENRSPVASLLGYSSQLKKMDKALHTLLLKKVPSDVEPTRSVTKQPLITEVLTMDKLHISYAGLYPGEAQEEPLELHCKGFTEVSFRLEVFCEDEELAALDEYVFSARASGDNTYHDKFLARTSPGSKAAFRIAVKVPQFKTQRIMRGRVEVTADGFRGKLKLPLACKTDLPSLIAPRQLLDTKNAQSVLPLLKFIIKTPKKQDLKIVLKNDGARTVQTELELLVRDETFGQLFEASLSPSILTFAPKGLATAVLTLRSRGTSLSCDFKELRCLIVAKLRNSSLRFTFPTILLPPN